MDIAVQRAQVAIRHRVQRKVRHRRPRGQVARLVDPLLLGEGLHVQAQVDRVGRAPRPAPSERIAGEPVFLVHLAAGHREPRRMAVVATGDRHQIASTLVRRRLARFSTGCESRVGRKSHAACDGGRDGGAAHDSINSLILLRSLAPLATRGGTHLGAVRTMSASRPPPHTLRMPIVELRTSHAVLAVTPELGGALTSLVVDGTPILRPTSAATLAAHDVTGTACYPLVPYSNRIRDATLHFAGRTFPLARNFGAHPHSIHGVGWQRPWSVETCSSTSVRLALVHAARGDDAGAWPWPFRATQTFHLTDGIHAGARCTTLVATLMLANAGSAPFPVGLGFHPFFAR